MKMFRILMTDSPFSVPSQVESQPRLVTSGGATRRSFISLVAGGALSVVLAVRNVVGADAANCVSANERALLGMINAYRAEHGLAALRMSSTVAAAAYTHSRDMATRNYLSHTTLGTSNMEGKRMTAAGYPSIGQTAYGEIIYRGSGSLATPQEAFNWWKNSSGHNARMLDARYTTAGVGRSNNFGNSQYTYSTVDFAGKFDRAASSCA